MPETGWTDKYPYKSEAGDEYYFVRRKDRNDVVVMGFSMGKAWLNGVSYEQSELSSHLFLGPLHPPDFEQHVRLRGLVQDAERFLAWWCESTNPNPPHGVKGAKSLLKALRAAFSPELSQRNGVKP
ncbi:MAG TPA: hypothetical protein VF290_02490 [Pyrinomonadaceae bacterium]